MIIDAMDLLYTGEVDGFCLASSDSDFTRLATRLREAGKIVIGMGEKKTPAPFVKACSQFKYIDVLSGEEKKQVKNTKAKKSAKAEPAKSDTAKTETKNKRSANARSDKKEPAAEAKPAEPVAEPIAEPVAKEGGESSATPLEEIELAIRKIIEDNEDESGLIPASKVGSILQNRYPDFDTRNYGCRRMTDLLKLLNIPTQSFNDPNNPVPNAALLFIKTK